MTPTPTLLVIDDELDTVGMLSDFLAHEGFRVLAACSAREALGILARETPDLILMDLAMPEIDGFELCRRLATSPRCSQIPVIVITALDAFSDYSGMLCDLFPIRLFVYKPFAPAKLAENIRYALALPAAQS
ncbi:MAG: response regulator [Planctomycetes bacterium]|nr:response regulator [Planctomycetota bacterium]